MKKTRFYFLMGAFCLALPLSACQTTHDAQRVGEVDAALARAAADASVQGNTKQSLALLEQIYKRDSSNADNASNYARALREEGRLNRAILVLTPFIGDEAKTHVGACTEYANVQAALGNYAEAEAHARRAVLESPESAQGYHILGIALDAQGHHQQAETAFRKALEHWKGDPAPVLNNLGLNLATQGFLDEAVDTLRKAAAISPDRTEIERNLRIVAALQEQPPKPGSLSAQRAPVPAHKPINTAFKGVSVPEPAAGDAPAQPVEAVEAEPAQ